MYTIQSEGTRFWTGTTGETQVILGGVLPDIRVYIFNREGKFLELKSFSIEVLLGGAGMSNEDLFLSVEKALRQVMHLLGIHEGTIKIQEYADEVFSLSELTDELQDFVNNRERYTDDEKEELDEIYNDWKNSQYYALYWVEEYWMTSEGELECS
ncbi:hypothetical protein Enr10x_03760 [Gimesia panareensis]|uniref:Uncharacterized protein n=2 Tax=Gimesia panareensis TaxID=2527978 RepID=A0A517Q0D3_9PLAN|nr:hypothetical protein Enr10x_03760 [Gimesia panareensis]